MNISQSDSADSELSGYLELGMIAEAEELALQHLKEQKISPATFNEAMNAVLVSDGLDRWRADIETAYGRLTIHERSAVRFKMLSFYWSIRDFALAREFIRIRTCHDPSELLITIQVLLQFDRVHDARVLARRCERKLQKRTSELDEGFLRDALGTFYGRMREPLLALEHWKNVPTASPCLHTALLSSVEVCLWPALTAVSEGLEVVARKKRDPDLSLEVQQPGLEAALTSEIERDLLRLKRKLHKIVPPSRQKELGIYSTCDSPLAPK